MSETDPIDITATTDLGDQLGHWEGDVVIEHIPGGGLAGAIQHGDGTANYRLDVKGDIHKGNLEADEGISIALKDGRAVTIQNS